MALVLIVTFVLRVTTENTSKTYMTITYMIIRFIPVHILLITFNTRAYTIWTILANIDHMSTNLIEDFQLLTSTNLIGSNEKITRFFYIFSDNNYSNKWFPIAYADYTQKENKNKS